MVKKCDAVQVGGVEGGELNRQIIRFLILIAVRFHLGFNGLENIKRGTSLGRHGRGGHRDKI